MLLKVIPKILSMICLFEHVSEVDIKRPLPTFESFLDKINSKREVKKALLEIHKENVTSS